MLNTDKKQKTAAPAEPTAGNVLKIAASPKAGSVPDEEFWRDEVEVPYYREIAARLAEPKYLRSQLERFNGRMLRVACRRLHLDEEMRPAEIRGALLSRPRDVLPLLLAQAAGAYKARVAIERLAGAVFTASELADYTTRSDALDHRALVLGLFDRDPQHLKTIHLTSLIHSRGFAPMVVNKNVRGRHGDPEAFLTQDKVQAALDEYERRNGSRRISRCVGILNLDKGIVVFIKRQDKASFHFDADGNRAGFTPEWIVLDFHADLRRLRIASQTIDVPVHIAAELASEYFGTEVGYENEDETTDEDSIRSLLASLLDEADPDLDLVEARVANTGLPGKAKVTITHAEPIVDAVREFSAQWGDLFRDLDSVEAIKLKFCEKRITMVFKRDDQRWTVEYGDARMNSFERRQFESHLRDEHDIPARSTEKRFADISAA
jgi:hypothetical protein